MLEVSRDELGRVRVLLDRLGDDLHPFTLIGGSATNTRVGGDTNRDIDLIVGSPDLRTKLRTVPVDDSENRQHSGGVGRTRPTRWRARRHVHAA